MHHRQAFTLIELLIVIAVIAIISVVIVLVLNPAELLRQARDSNRLSDMASMVDAFGVYSAQGGTSYGSANTVYVSIADPTATSTAGDQCQGLGLISLPATYSYHCAASSTYRAIDGTGWIPVNFNAVSSRSPLGQLAIDPLNSSSSRLYYTYTTNGSQYEVTSVMESQKYGVGGSNDVISGDGGTLASVYERGTQLGLEPLDYGDSSLVGYWTFDEGTGTIAYDYSGNGNNGSWSGTQAGSSGYYSSGKGGGYQYAGYFDGSTDYVTAPGTPAVPLAYTVVFWMEPLALSSGATIIMDDAGTYQYRPILTTSYIYDARGAGSVGFTPSTNSWTFVTLTYTGTQSSIYINGALNNSVAATYSMTGTGTMLGQAGTD